MRIEKAVQDWINTSLALNFNNEEKTSEPEVKIDPPECPSHNNGETMEDHNTEISRQSFPKIAEVIKFQAMRPCSNLTLK